MIDHNENGDSESHKYNIPKTQDLETLFNIPDFYFLLNNEDTCKNDTIIQALIIVTSYFGNVETRSAMRRAFSQEDLKQLNLRRIFLLGKAPTDKYTTQKAIENESLRFKDIIQGNFIEAYRNLTFKHVMGLKWAARNCFNAKFVIKMDDDIVVNIEKISSILNSLRVSNHNKLIAGYVLRNMVPIREPANKWFVTEEEYSLSAYPLFVSGWFYVTTPQTCKNLVNLSNTTRYFWIDDTYVTGILAKKLRIKHYDIKKYFTVHSEFLDCCLDDIRSRNLNCEILVGPNGGNPNMFYEFNNAIQICNMNLCRNRTSPIDETCVAKKVDNLGRGQGSINSYKLH
ncbi:unnamed protein product [Phaedon cochleariae]|uniref:Hexosyltransferase n=1 Tax=Phaedon cochleariae TaxID=80249 RepID=A0A9N9SK14_PHACE|nr:unnamed protein product [Phaedon cochleariae]